MSQHYHLKSLPWDIVEKAITEEIKWLKNTIVESPFKNKNNPFGLCKNCIYRQIAILIVSGKIKAKDIKSTVSLWGKEKLPSLYKPHGKEWHTEMMNLVASYFKSKGCDITLEPWLNIGRADLGVYKKGKRDLFVEIESISLPKLLFNL